MEFFNNKKKDYSGPLRELTQQLMSSGGILGESSSSSNTTKIFYGILKEPDLNLPEENDDLEGNENEKPKVIQA